VVKIPACTCAYLQTVMGKLNNNKIRRSASVNELTSQSDIKKVLLNFQSEDQKPLKKTGRIPKSLISRGKFLKNKQKWTKIKEK
jgi:hypothetical protein